MRILHHVRAALGCPFHKGICKVAVNSGALWTGISFRKGEVRRPCGRLKSTRRAAKAIVRGFNLPLARLLHVSPISDRIYLHRRRPTLFLCIGFHTYLFLSASRLPLP